MKIEEIIKDIDNMDLTNNRTLDEIQEFEYFLRECIRHNLSLEISDTSEEAPEHLNLHTEDCGILIKNAVIEDVWEEKGEGTIWFTVWFYGYKETVNFDDMPIDALIEIVKWLE